MARVARIALVAVVIAAVQLETASADKKDDARRLFEAAEESYNDKDFAEAPAQYQEVYEAIKSPLLHFNIAQCHRGLGQWAEASARFRRYLREADKPDNAEGVELAIRQLDRLIEAVDHQRQSRHERALEIYTDVRENADLPVLERDIARTHERLGEYDEARAAYRKYLDELPQAPDREDIEKAIARLDRELDPGVTNGEKPGRTPIYKKWWFWGGLAVVVAGGVTAIALSGGPPGSALGNVGFDR